MTLLYVTTTTTTTVERQIHAVTDDECVGLLSAWRGVPAVVTSRVVEQVRTDVVNALTSEASGVLEDGIVAVDGLPLTDAERHRRVAEAWTLSMAPVVDAEISGRTVNAVLGAQ